MTPQLRVWGWEGSSKEPSIPGLASEVGGNQWSGASWRPNKGSIFRKVEQLAIKSNALPGEVRWGLMVIKFNDVR